MPGQASHGRIKKKGSNTKVKARTSKTKKLLRAIGGVGFGAAALYGTDALLTHQSPYGYGLKTQGVRSILTGLDKVSAKLPDKGALRKSFNALSRKLQPIAKNSGNRNFRRKLQAPPVQKELNKWPLQRMKFMNQQILKRDLQFLVPFVKLETSPEYDVRMPSGMYYRDMIDEGLVITKKEHDEDLKRYKQYLAEVHELAANYPNTQTNIPVRAAKVKAPQNHDNDNIHNWILV